MSVETTSLTGFLLARIAEDEELWQMAADADLAFVAGPGRLKAVPPTDFSRRMLAECAAKRAIVELGPSECGGHEDQAEFDSHHYPDPAWSHCDGCSAAESADFGWRGTLKLLAAVYAEHPDYRDEWKP